jgi:hypothetical protein
VVTMHTAAERPDLWERAIDSALVWPDYNLPRSMLITGSVTEWESWTGLALPESGDYVFPEGLAPLTVDVAADRCTYWEPNVWMVHPDIDPQVDPV